MDVVLSTFAPIKSGPVGDQADNPIGVSVAADEAVSPLSATSTSNTAPLDTSPNPVSGTTGSSKTTSSEQIVPQVSGRVFETEDEQQFLSFLIPEDQESVQVSSNINHSSAKGLKDDHQEQEVGELNQNIEASVVKSSKLQDEVGRLQKEMSAILEAMKQLEKQ
ncbi:hypothetical protein BGW38_008793, partial [Lunasporangiospora selenospora]